MIANSPCCVFACQKSGFGRYDKTTLSEYTMSSADWPHLVRVDIIDISAIQEECFDEMCRALHSNWAQKACLQHDRSFSQLVYKQECFHQYITKAGVLILNKLFALLCLRTRHNQVRRKESSQIVGACKGLCLPAVKGLYNEARESWVLASHQHWSDFLKNCPTRRSAMSWQSWHSWDSQAHTVAQANACIRCQLSTI